MQNMREITLNRSSGVATRLPAHARHRSNRATNSLSYLELSVATLFWLAIPILAITVTLAIVPGILSPG